MSSRSSNSDDPRLLLLGRVSGHRGGRGELTVRLSGGGEAARWTHLHKVWIGPTSSDGRPFEVERCRGYRDRLVLKLRGVDDPSEAAGLRGHSVLAFEDELPDLPEGVYYTGSLVGLEVLDEHGRTLGRVAEVLPTGGTDLLRVVPSGLAPAREGEPLRELLIPMARAIVREISLEQGWIRVRLPEGLLDL